MGNQGIRGNPAIIKRSDFCSHVCILVTASTTREAPYKKCSKCGDIQEVLGTVAEAVKAGVFIEYRQSAGQVAEALQLQKFGRALRLVPEQIVALRELTLDSRRTGKTAALELRPYQLAVAARFYLGDCDPCDPWPRSHPFEREPEREDCVWYRGWEVSYEFASEHWTGNGWRAYKGGCDLGAREVSSGTYQGCLDEIDEAEDDW